MSTWREGYCQGGPGPAAKRRERARRAGIASGVARRQLSTVRRPPRARSRQMALSLVYRVRQVGPQEFEERYRAMCAAYELPFDRRGLNTALELYRVELASYRAQGQDHETTNGQRARGLELHGRARGRRTVQRTRKRLVLMGLVAYEHVKRSGQARIPGQMDTLRVRCLCPARANDTPPSGARAQSFQDCSALACTSTSTPLSAPPTAADEIAPLRGADLEGEQEPGSDSRRLRFLELMAEHAPAMLRDSEVVELHRLRSSVAGHSTALIASTTWAGFR